MDAVEKELRMTQHRGPMQNDEYIPDTRVVDEAVLAEIDVASLLARLSPRNALIMTMIYLKGLTLRETGEAFGLTESRICQIRRDAITTLRGLCHSLKEQAA